MTWSGFTVPWYAHPSIFTVFEDEALAEEELIAAFDAWTDVDCSGIRLPYRGETLSLAGFENSRGVPNQNVVILAERWPYDAGAIAITTTAYNTETGTLVDADIEVNRRFTFQRISGSCDPRSGIMDFRNALTHEVGHLLGLDHPTAPRLADATMYGTAPACETKKRSLEQDDADGICSIYPEGGEVTPCIPPGSAAYAVEEGKSGCTHTTGESTGSLWLTGVVFGLGWWRRRR